AVVLERLGWSLLTSTSAVKDPAVRKQMRDRARAALLRSQQLGNNSNLLRTALEGLRNPDPTNLKFSQNVEADRAMREGEEAHVRGELDKAIAAYERAFKLDPKLYLAPLFAGDMYFKKREWDKAGEWFARAVALNADVETAHRYWGDALMMGQNKKEESRDKFVEAIVADPYNRRAWMGLTQWAQRYGVRLAHPRVEPAAGVSSAPNGNTTITIDPKSLDRSDDGSSAWMMYGISRAAWKVDKFKKEYPAETTYRHSLREEADALRMTIESVRQQMKDKKIKTLDPMLANLLKLEEEGLLEAFILFARADEGIARDYAAYRAANRDRLRRYLTQYVAADK
ncbi:MAG: tetratricopeptide repeat protein, partial [Pyrinomonadaceae bacterium]